MSLDLKNVQIRRKEFLLQATVSIETGKIYALLGPSGCGKTTLLRAVAGLEPLTSGEIWLDGRRIDHIPTEKRQIGFVFQDLALFEQFNVSKNIAYGLRIQKIPKNLLHERVTALAQRFKIEHLLDRFPASLSGGEKQRVAFARALAPQPAIILLDEPLSALDAPLRREMRSFIRTQLADQGLTAIHVTHDAEEAADIADEIVVMKDGKIVGKGNWKMLEKEPRSAWLAKFMNFGILIPVQKFEEDGHGLSRATTKFGNFFCQKPLFPFSEIEHEAVQSYQLYLYIPFSALEIADTNENKQPNTFPARIMRISPAPHGETKILLKLESTEEYSFELVTRLSDIEPGQRASLLYDPDRARILPANE